MNEIERTRKGVDETQPLVLDGDHVSNYLSAVADENAVGTAGSGRIKRASLFTRVRQCLPRGKQLVVMILAFCILNLVYLVGSTEKLYSRAISVELEKLEVVNLTDSGVAFRASARSELDYGRVGRIYHRTWLRMLSLIGEIGVEPRGEFAVFVSVDEQRSVHVFDVEITKEFEVGLTFGESRELMVEGRTRLNPDSVAALVNEISMRNDDLLMLGVGTTVPCHFRKGGLPVIPKKIHYLNSFPLNATEGLGKITRNMELADISVINSDDGSEFHGNADILLPAGMMEFSIGELNWEVGLLGCFDEEVLLGEFTSGEIVSKAGESTIVSVNYAVSSLSEELTSECDEEDCSPISKIVSQLAANKNVPVVLSGATNKTAPKWLSRLLDKLHFRLQLALTRARVAPVDDPIYNEIITSFGVAIEDGNAVIDSDLQFSIKLPSEIAAVHQMDVQSVSGCVSVMNGGERVCNLVMEKWQQSHLDSELLRMAVNLKGMKVDILDSQQLASDLQQLINGRSYLETEVALNMELRSPFVNTTLNKLSRSVNLTVPTNPFDDIMGQTDVRLHNIVLLDSSRKKVDLVLELGVQNPANLSLKSDISSVKLDMAFNGSFIGNIEIQQFHLPALSESNMTTVLTLDTQSESAKSKLEEFFGSYLSGKSPRVVVKGNKECVGKNELSKVLEKVEMEVAVPEIRGAKEVETEADEEVEVQENSIFLLDSTMHIMSSEVELTVYNPICNSEIVVNLIEAKASFEKTTLGYISKEQTIVIPPGVYRTPRIPVKYATSGLGADILRKAINGKLKVDTTAMMRVHLGEFEMELLYTGSGTETKIRL